METVHDLERSFRRCLARNRIADFTAKGWTLRTAAQHLGVHWTHLHKVMQGQRISRSLSAKIQSLPVNL